jgi:raffinose/stachyose/melibiose transport system permease protein
VRRELRALRVVSADADQRVREGDAGRGQRVPGVVTAGILAFIGSWNNYVLPLYVLNSQSNYTLPLGVQAFSSQCSTDTAKVLAFTSLAMLPALVFFSIFQKRIVGGLTGAVKG